MDEVKKADENAGAERCGNHWPIVAMRMPPEQVQQLKAHAAALCLSVSDVIRTALLQKGAIKPLEA